MKRSSLQRSRWPKTGDMVLWLATGLATLLVLTILLIILIDVVKNGASRLTLGFLTKATTDGMTAGGIFPAIFGTVALVILMTIVALPAGVATAMLVRARMRRRFARSHG